MIFAFAAAVPAILLATSWFKCRERQRIVAELRTRRSGQLIPVERTNPPRRYTDPHAVSDDRLKSWNVDLGWGRTTVALRGTFGVSNVGGNVLIKSEDQRLGLGFLEPTPNTRYKFDLESLASPPSLALPDTWVTEGILLSRRFAADRGKYWRALAAPGDLPEDPCRVPESEFREAVILESLRATHFHNSAVALIEKGDWVGVAFRDEETSNVRVFFGSVSSDREHEFVLHGLEEGEALALATQVIEHFVDQRDGEPQRASFKPRMVPAEDHPDRP